MKKQKRYIKTLYAILSLLLASVFLLAACKPKKPDDPAHKHVLTEIAQQDATCTEKGNETYWKCNDCGKMFSDQYGNYEIKSIPEIAAKGHSVPSMTETRPADCTNKGQKSGKCERCGQTVTEDIPALGHDMQWNAVGEMHEKKCSVCGKQEGELQPHNYNADGHCVECGAQRQDEHKHSLSAVPEKDATCTEKGNKAYWKCNDCGKMFSDQYGNHETKSIPEIAAKGHSVPSMTETKPADCTNKGQKSGTCERCGQIFNQDIAALGHNLVWTSVDEQTHIKKCTRCEYTDGNAESHNFQGDECTLCGAKQATKPYIISDDGTKLTFGSYPQTEVQDNALKSMLNASIQNKTPSADESNGWTDYNYYIGGAVEHYMWYIDIEYQNEKYRGVYFSQYRPSQSNYGSGATGSNQDENGYNIETVYWFKFEPITWRILTQQDGKAFVVADMVLDCMETNTELTNKYDESHVRNWLNETFIKTALGDAEKYVAVTTVDNSAASTAAADNPNACDDTRDKVFLLSYSEVTNSDYGFDFAMRKFKTSAYSKCQGAFTKSDYGWMLLRSPDADGNMLYVSNIGYVSASNYRRVTDTTCGIVPALWLIL